jgi:hypothetical protein
MSDITAEFVRGFASRACQVDTSMSELVMTSGDDSLLERIGVFLRRHGIHCQTGPVGDRFKLRVRGFKPLTAWLAVIGPLDAERSHKLSTILTSLESQGNERSS